jgi:EAL domain-containing protein (putative c-di-GMP-specific phosphodiesterase class I)
MNVNLSKRQLMEASLPDLYGRMIQDAGVSPSTVKLEITESTIMEDHYDVAEILRAIKSKGIRLAMDDFGTGHSSLSCLHQFPIDVLKIDRSFVSNMEGSRQFAAVLDAIITLAQHLDMDVVAEGIENRVQLAQLQAMDCGYAQGYFFAQPLPAEQAATFLSRDIRVTDAA